MSVVTRTRLSRYSTEEGVEEVSTQDNPSEQHTDAATDIITLLILKNVFAKNVVHYLSQLAQAPFSRE